MNAAVEQMESERVERKPELGIHDDIPEDQYHSSPGISKHGLDLLHQSPLHYKVKRTEETKALIYGGAFHMLVLEPHKFDQRYIVNTKYDAFRSNDSKAWLADMHDQGFRVISQDEYDHMQRMRDAIRSHPWASILLDPELGRAEQSCYWIDNSYDIWDGEKPTYRLCRCRPDFINDAHRAVIDLKTTICAGESKFLRQVIDLRYDVQDAFYRDGLNQLGYNVSKFWFVAIEKEPPYGIGIFDISAELRREARHIYQRDLLTYHKCMTDNHWPCYAEEPRTLEKPNYAKFRPYY